MRNVGIIAIKEIRTYFSTPMAYVVAAAFLAITGFFFVASVSDAVSEATARGFLAGAVFFMIFLSPAITMRLLAEEQKLGTLELLLTSPLREVEVVIGKWLAAFVMVMIMGALTIYYVVVLYIFGVPDPGPILTGYLGLTLYAGATLSIGLFASALSPNQLVGLVVGSGILTAFTIIDMIAERLTGIAARVFDGFQLGGSFSVFDRSSFGIAEGGHFADFARGVISVNDIVYYVSLTIVFLFLTIITLEIRRWR